jgi:hypothetical protein
VDYCPSRQELGKTRVHASKDLFLSVYTRVEISGRVNTNISTFLQANLKNLGFQYFLAAYTYIIFILMA